MCYRGAAYTGKEGEEGGREEVARACYMGWISIKEGYRICKEDVVV